MQNEPIQSLPPPPWHRALPRIALRLAVILVLVWALSAFYGWAHHEIEMLEVGQSPFAMLGLVLVTIGIYALVMAIPFVPAVEIAIVLLLMNGAAVAPFVYLGTVAGLLLAFGIGRLVSLDVLHNAFRDLHMMRACALLMRIKTEDPANRLQDLSDRLPPGLRWLIVDYRYLTLGLLLNIPGNVALGGGGGIMMLAGISRLFRTVFVVVTLLVATLPVPLLVWLWGVDFLA